jgi:hypothetical protein
MGCEGGKDETADCLETCWMAVGHRREGSRDARRGQARRPKGYLDHQAGPSTSCSPLYRHGFGLTEDCHID